MAYFHNKKKVWKHISNEINNESKEYFERNYTHENFLKDFERMSRELCIYGQPAEPILNAKKQIAVMDLSVQAITAAVAVLKENPENIDLAYLEMILVFKEIKDQKDQFETTLQSVIPIIKKLDGMDNIAKALQMLADANRTHDQLVEVTSIPENFSQTLLDADLLVIKKIKQINKALLDEAANVTFKDLFEKNKLLSTDSNQSECDSTQRREREEYFKSFLKLFLHQGFIYPSINVIFTDNEDYQFSNPEKRTIDLSYLGDSLVIEVSFFIQKVWDKKSSELLIAVDDDYFVKGVAKFKINVKPYNLTDWVARVELMDSVLECKPEYKNILDTRSILEKFQEYLVAILEKLKACLNSNTTTFKPFFFVSQEGNSALPKQSLDSNSDDSGKVLNLLINSMT